VTVQPRVDSRPRPITEQLTEPGDVAPAQDLSIRRRAGAMLTGAMGGLIALVFLSITVIGSVGGDARWLGVLGKMISSSHRTDDGIPFASAPSAGWHNVPVLAELAFSVLMGLAGDHGLVMAQAAAVTAALVLLARDARRAGAQDRSIAVVLLLVALGCSTTLLIARLQMFSLALLPLELGLLRAEARRPSPRIWLLVPLLAVWSNLHGAVLVGAAVAASYLLLSLSQHRPRQAAAVGMTSLLALCLTPALAFTPAYYLGVLQNETARQHVGLWARLTLSSPFDVAMLLVAGALVPAVLRSRPRVWEIAALLGLVALTVQTSRNGVWLLFVAAGPAAAGWGRRRGSTPAVNRRVPVAALLWTAAAAVAVVGVLRGPSGPAPAAALVNVAVHTAAGRPVTAEGVLSEQVVAAGGRVWLTNPLDAFSHADQRRYVAWTLTGRTDLLPSDSSVVVVQVGSPAAQALADSPEFQRIAANRAGMVYQRRSTQGGRT
jgi:hypothetical protein